MVTVTAASAGVTLTVKSDVGNSSAHEILVGRTAREETLEARPILYAPVGEGNLEWEDIIAVCKKNGVKSYAIEQDKCNGRNAFDCVASSFRFMKNAGI